MKMKEEIESLKKRLSVLEEYINILHEDGSPIKECADSLRFRAWMQELGRE